MVFNIKSNNEEHKKTSTTQNNNVNKLGVVNTPNSSANATLENSCSLLTIDVTKEQAFKLYQDIQTQLQRMQQQGLDENVIDLIAHKSYVGIPQGRILRQGYKTSYTLPPYADDTSTLANVPEELLLIELIKKRIASYFVKQYLTVI